MTGAWSNSVAIFEGEDEAAFRERYAQIAAQFRNLNPYEIAGHVFKGLRDAPARAGQAASLWSRDPDVLKRIDELRRNGFAEDVEVEKTVIAQEVLALARDGTIGVKERLDAYKLVSELEGFIQKGGNVNVAVQVNRVMKVTDHGSDDAWEARLAQQQRGLMANASSSH